jgi:hypothetical protein
MNNPSQTSELALRTTWTRARRQAAPAVGWVKGITHSPRRAALSGCAIVLLIVAIVTPCVPRIPSIDLTSRVALPADLP